MRRRTIRQRLAAGILPAAVMGAAGVGVAMAAVAKPTVSMRGSPASMERQHEVAVAEDFTFAATPAEVLELVSKERLVPLPGGANYMLNRVSFPYTRPEVRTFVENIAAEYRKGCGEQLVVTSLTRPRSLQPGNAHALSVHPAGMAVDFRISKSQKCRDWFEKALLTLERKDVLDATRERNPPHYHVAVYPAKYAAFAARTTPAAPPAASPTVLPPATVPAGRTTAPAAPAQPARRAAPAPAEGEAAQTGAVIAAAFILLGLGAFFWTQIRRAKRMR